MKLTKSIVALCYVIMCALSFASCEKETVNAVYGMGISQFKSEGSGSLSDLSNVESYLNSKGCPTEGQERIWYCTGESYEKCDKQAAAHFQNLVKNLSREEVSSIVSKDCSFTYSISRLADSSNPESETIYPAKWQYPAE
ncbi:MAG: hypothetical protein K6A36_03075 [Paludibacteraceae bacterium]|nr:hypothetical protein [Paludibacteraceae bacterium]